MPNCRRRGNVCLSLPTFYYRRDTLGLPAVWLIVNAKNGISSCEIYLAIGVTQKTAWFMGHRIRAALHSGSFQK